MRLGQVTVEDEVLGGRPPQCGLKWGKPRVQEVLHLVRHPVGYSRLRCVLARTSAATPGIRPHNGFGKATHRLY
jgi:hypothetical protein